MKYCVAVRNSLGVFKSRTSEGTQEDFDELCKFLETTNRMTYLQLEGLNGGQIYIPGDLLKKSVVSVFVIGKKEDES